MYRNCILDAGGIMVFRINYNANNEILLSRKAQKLVAIIFLFIGLFLEIIFLLLLVSFFDITDPLKQFWLEVGQTWLVSISSLLLLVGVGCILVSLVKLSSNESIAVKKEIKPNLPGIELVKRRFFLKKKKYINNTDITGLKVHVIPLDELKMFTSYRLELIYKDVVNVEQTTHSIILYEAEGSLASSDTLRLAKSIQNILKLPFDIEKVVTSPNTKNRKKVIKIIDFDQGI